MTHDTTDALVEANTLIRGGHKVPWSVLQKMAEQGYKPSDLTPSRHTGAAFH